MAVKLKLPADQAAEAVFMALGIEIPKNLCGFTLEVKSWGEVPTLTMTVVPHPVTANDNGEIVKETKKFRLELVNELQVSESALWEAMSKAARELQLKELTERTERLLKCPSKENKHIILDRVIEDIKPLSMTPNELDFIISGNLAVVGPVKDSWRPKAYSAMVSYTTEYGKQRVEGCPDCYVGLSGQIEKCEKHRA